MKKLLAFFSLVLIAVLLAGVYGMIHDQISYTVSPEYFTKFKFPQFGIAEMNLPDRARASMVGFLATWWMGIPIGLLVGGSGFIHHGCQRMFKVSLLSFGLVIMVTLLFGLGGLLYGFFQTRTINLMDYQGWFIPDNLTHLRRFLCVGYMHNASYIGGTASVFVGCFFQVIVKIKDAKQ